MKRILVPTDFSDNAMKAISYAAEIAQKSGSTILLLHVIEPIVNLGMSAVVYESHLNRITISKMNELETLSEAIEKTYPGVKTETELAQGPVIGAILDFAENNQVDLVVMGTKGANGLKEIILGSVTAGIISRTKLPVLAIPAEYVIEQPATILFATNHFEKNKAVLEKLVEMAKLFYAGIRVVVFVQKGKAHSAEYLFNAREMDFYIDFLTKAYPGISFKGELLEGKEFEDTIEEYDRKNEVDIISMITYPKNIIENLVSRSATRKMAFHSKIPLFALHAD